MSKAVEQAIRELVLFRRGKGALASAPDYSKADSLRSFVEQMEATGAFITIVWDYIQDDFLFLSDKFCNYFGFDPRNVRREKLAYLLNRLIPIDAIIMMNGSSYVWDYVSGLPMDLRKNYKVSAEFRMRNDYNKMIRVRYQNVTLEITDTGDFWLNLMLFEMAPDQDMELIGNISCIDAVSGETILTTEKVKEHLCRNILSKQELEVLRWIAKGKDSRQIAAKLNISENKVDQHRGQILKKIKTDDANDAAAFIRDVFVDSDSVRGPFLDNKVLQREQIVDLMNLTLHYWVESTGLSKADLAEGSGIWSVYLDGNGWRRTQTLDKYLNIQTLPKNPKISRVLQSAYYVLDKCKTSSLKREQILTALEGLKAMGHS